ncbi:hypothetical protein [Streptococcus mutans]|jgi:hypothetical protein|uniref:hypothetical protein n=2 Tax=Streptococcus mutans TaxID=1309 RepID=UPI0002B5F56F|nr:hypothetical protein [Streptococcus mutans]EMB76736.1 putative lipoprotein [Streptococcus mutans 11VS1]AVM71663.1 hypothetical protein CO204_06205 [Streptococcus mutans]EMC19643.1 putative lipoprotein [Streptococcus mutans SF1]MCB4962037.1 hypothetical protein [Streptococcus mutans]MCB5048729.1 hypothetical protein [Streptococcus mutans]
MTLLTGCQDKRNSREWLENKVSEVNRVYPKENLFDLFKEFPEGFTIHQNLDKGDNMVIMTLIGNKDSNTISGTLVQKDLSTKEEKVTTSISVDYRKNGDFIYSNSEKAKEIWPFGKFLFQDLTIDKMFLSDLKLKGTSYNWQNGAFNISYDIENSLINKYMMKGKQEQAILKIGSTNSNKDIYSYAVSIKYKDGTDLLEMISN